MSLDLNFCAGDNATEDEIFVENRCVNNSDVTFHLIIGTIEDMLIGDEFFEMQHKFLEQHWNVFDDTEENKLIYMDIFKEYQDKLEIFIEEYLKRTIQNFDMNDFLADLQMRKDDLDGEIFEVLFSFTDFSIFKEMFLDYKAMKEGKTADFSKDISIVKI